MKILHLVNDWWLTDCAVSIFKGYPFLENRFVFIQNADGVNTPLKIVKSVSDIERIAIGSDAYKDLLKPGQWDLVWVHGMHAEKIPFLRALDNSVKIFWMTWGFDYLDLQVQWLYSPRTMLYWLRHKRLLGVFRRVFFWIANKIGIVRFLPWPACRVFPKISYISSVVPTEEPLIRRLVGNRPKWLAFHCMKRKPVVEQYPVVNLDSKKMIAGNSAYITCNHLDVFHIVARFKNYQIFSPLSYTMDGGIGGSTYADDMIEEGQRLLGERFHPLKDYMPYVEYLKLLSSCSVYVYGNRRQQALGNINMALKMGGIVFLHPANPIYKYYKNNGVLIYSISELRPDKIDGIIAEFRPRQSENIQRINELSGFSRLLANVDATMQYLLRDVCSKSSV